MRDCTGAAGLPASRTRTDYLSALRQCHTRLVQGGIDLSAYNDLTTADDVYAIQRALGYKTVNVLALSYGTRRTLLFMRRHPAGIRSVVLVSVVPTQFNTIPAPAAEFMRVVTFLTRGCAAAPACHRRYPQLQTVVAQLIARLNTHPLVVTGVGRVTGEALVGLLDRVVFATVQNVPALPAALSQLAAGNDAQLVTYGWHGRVSARCAACRPASVRDR